MPASYGGLKYEKDIIKTLITASNRISNLKVLDQDQRGGFDNTTPDITVLVNNELVHIEVKKNNKAQFGGTSIRYSVYTDEISYPNLILDTKSASLAETLIRERAKCFQDFIDFVKRCKPVSYHETIDGFPCACAKESWTAARRAGLLIPLNSVIRQDISFIARHYAAKGVDYIQIGKSGLFYLNDNKLNLPISKLDGEIDVEIRSGRSGSRERQWEGYHIKTVGGGIRMQARLKFSPRSDYSLDNVDDVCELFL